MSKDTVIEDSKNNSEGNKDLHFATECHRYFNGNCMGRGHYSCMSAEGEIEPYWIQARCTGKCMSFMNKKWSFELLRFCPTTNKEKRLKLINEIRNLT